MKKNEPQRTMWGKLYLLKQVLHMGIPNMLEVMHFAKSSKVCLYVSMYAIRQVFVTKQQWTYLTYSRYRLSLLHLLLIILYARTPQLPMRIKHQKKRVPTTNDVTGTVKLSSSSVLMGCDSTSVAARETTRKPKAICQVSSIKPKEWK
jgi:hypothetical protein